MNIITSRNGKKEATISYTIAGGIRVAIVNTLAKDLVISKGHFIDYKAAAKWAIKTIN